MSKVYYHNITRNILNRTDVVDFLDDYQEGDKLYFSVAGNALLEEISEERFRKIVEIWAVNSLENINDLVVDELKKLWQL